MNVPPEINTWVTYVADAQKLQIRLGLVTDIRHGLVSIVETGIPSWSNMVPDQRYFSLEVEGREWIRGKHAAHSEQAQALLVTYVLSKPT